jgi:hypothetical protein
MTRNELKCYDGESTKTNTHIYIFGALAYKPEGPGFKSPMMTTTPQPRTQMNTGNIKKKMFLGSKVQPVHEANNLTAVGAFRGILPQIPNRYPSNSPINRISMVTNNHKKKTCIVASSVFTWVRLKAVNETGGSVLPVGHVDHSLKFTS